MTAHDPGRRRLLKLGATATVLGMPARPATATTTPPRTILALGDSTTENGRGYGTDWPHLVTTRSGGAFHVVNGGRSRDTAAMMGARLDPLLADHPDVDTVIVGTGTVEAQAAGLYGITTTLADLERILNVVASRGLRPVVLSVPPLGRPPGHTRSRHAISAAIYQRQGFLAQRRGWAFIDRYRPLADDLGELRPELYTLRYAAPHDAQVDEVHPDETGRSVTADVVLAALRALS